MVFLSVDNTASSIELDRGTDLETNTADPLYIGCYPPAEAEHLGIKSNIQYEGCIKDIEINGKKQDIFSSVSYNNVAFNLCPTSH